MCNQPLANVPFWSFIGSSSSRGSPQPSGDEMVSPVIQEESDDARKATAGAMSCGCPIRPSGVDASACLRKSLEVIPALCVPSVSTMPGLIEFTRMLRGPSSLANERVTASTAAFVALYTEPPGTPQVLTMELVLMMLPPAGPKCLSASCVVRINPSTFKLKCLWKCSSVIASRGDIS